MSLRSAFMEGRESLSGTDRHHADRAWENSRAKRWQDDAARNQSPTPQPSEAWVEAARAVIDAHDHYLAVMDLSSPPCSAAMIGASVRSVDRAIATMRTALAALDPPATGLGEEAVSQDGGVPAGWRLVPEEPTDEMAAAFYAKAYLEEGAIAATTREMRDRVIRARTKIGYRAMLASSPPPPGEGGSSLQASPSAPGSEADGARQDGWRPIASAPRDGTRVLIYGPSHGTAPLPELSHAWGRVDFASEVGEGYFAAGLWQFRQRCGEPTHWRPLPPPPATPTPSVELPVQSQGEADA